jgi:hypothetical protein
MKTVESYRGHGYIKGDKLPNGAIYMPRDVSSSSGDPDNAHPEEVMIDGMPHHFEDMAYSDIEWAPSSKV